MAEVSGEGGCIRFTNGETSVHNWTLSYVGDALETTDFDDSGLRTYIPGITSWSGSFDCYYSTGNTFAPGTTYTSLSMLMSTSANDGFKGNVIITGEDISTPVDGIITQTYTFQGTGALGTST